MKINEAYVMSRTIKEDYFWVPQLPPSAQSAREKFRENDRRYDRLFSIAQIGGTVYLHSNRMRTQRRDHVDRPITSSVFLETESLDTALRVYDARSEVLDWAEEFFMSNGAIDSQSLINVIQSVNPRTSLNQLQLSRTGIYTIEPAPLALRKKPSVSRKAHNTCPFRSIDDLSQWYESTIDGLSRAIVNLSPGTSSTQGISEIQATLISATAIGRVYSKLHEELTGRKPTKIYTPNEIIKKYGER